LEYARLYNLTVNGRVTKAKTRAKRRAAKKIETTLTTEEWQEILKAHKSKCYWCKKRLKPDEITMDHVIPLSKGGHHSKENLVLACLSCNSTKYNRLWTLL